MSSQFGAWKARCGGSRLSVARSSSAALGELQEGDREYLVNLGGVYSAGEFKGGLNKPCGEIIHG